MRPLAGNPPGRRLGRGEHILDRRLTTILAADMVGYSRLMAADEEGVIQRLRSIRARIVDPSIAEGDGMEKIPIGILHGKRNQAIQIRVRTP